VNLNKDQIQAWLDEVMDPEIPTISIVDLGIVTDIRIESSLDSTESVWVELTPTFSGCPALKIMEQLVKDKLSEKGIANIDARKPQDQRDKSNQSKARF